MSDRRSDVRVGFWTNDNVEQTSDLISRELARCGYAEFQAPGTDPARTTWQHKTSGPLASLWRPHFLIVDVCKKHGHTTLTLLARCHPLLETWARPSLTLISSFVALAVPLFALLPTQIGTAIAPALFPIILLSPLLGALLYPSGMVAAVLWYYRCDRIVARAFLAGDYPIHRERSPVDARESAHEPQPPIAPFGIGIWSGALVLMSSFAVLVLILLFAASPAQLRNPAIWMPVVVLFAFLAVAYRQARRRVHKPASVTSGHRSLVACTVVLTYAILALGVHGHHLLYLADAEAAANVGGVGAALFFGTLACILITSWKLVDDSRRSLQNLAAHEEFAEHQGSEVSLGLHVAILLIGTLASAGWWLSLAVLLDLTGLLPTWLSNLGVSAVSERVRSLPAMSQLLSLCCVVTFLSMRCVSVVAFAGRWLRSRGRQLEPCSVERELPEILDRARAVRNINVRFVTSPSHSIGASSCLASWWQPSYLILVGRELVKPDAVHRRRAIVAHELAHCLLRHHARTRILRIFGFSLVLDPVFPTLFIDHTRNEEDADTLAVELLGDDVAARTQLADVLEQSQQDVLRGFEPSLHPVVPYGFFSSPSIAERSPEDVGVLHAAFLGLQDYLLCEGVIYIHPSFSHRIDVLRAERGLERSP